LVTSKDGIWKHPGIKAEEANGFVQAERHMKMLRKGGGGGVRGFWMFGESRKMMPNFEPIQG